MAKQVKTKSNKLIYYLIAGVVVAVAFLFVGKSAGWIGKSKDLEVDMAKAKKATIVEKVSASGTVQPVTEVKLAPGCQEKSLNFMLRMAIPSQQESCW
jgi:HlyD family secretion protein